MGTPGQALATQEAVRQALRGRRFDAREWMFQGALLGALLLSLLVLIVLLYSVVENGLSVFQERGADFLTSGISSFDDGSAGVRQGLVGSAVILVIVTLVAIPLGVAAAVYLEEYATDSRFNRLITVNIRNLAGVPSIVYGLLGLALFVEIGREFTGGKTMIAGGLTLAVLVLPIVIITASEALRAVPSNIREAGYGVGATRWEVVRHHVLPSAAPGILTGVVLSLARALGETAPILLVGAVTGFLATGNAGLYEQLYDRFTTLPTIVFQYSSLPSDGFRANASAAIIVLLGVILTANAIAIALRNRYERKW